MGAGCCTVRGGGAQSVPRSQWIWMVLWVLLCEESTGCQLARQQPSSATHCSGLVLTFLPALSPLAGVFREVQAAGARDPQVVPLLHQRLQGAVQQVSRVHCCDLLLYCTAPCRVVPCMIQPCCSSAQPGGRCLAAALPTHSYHCVRPNHVPLSFKMYRSYVPLTCTAES